MVGTKTAETAGTRLRRLRMQLPHRPSQEALGEEIRQKYPGAKCGQGYMSQLENDAATPTVPLAIALADYYGWTMDALWRGIGEPLPDDLQVIINIYNRLSTSGRAMLVNTCEIIARREEEERKENVERWKMLLDLVGKEAGEDARSGIERYLLMGMQGESLDTFAKSIG